VAIQFNCHECNRALAIDDRHAGARVKCPQCGAVLSAPEAPASKREERPKRPRRRAPEAMDESEEEAVSFVKRGVEDEGIDMTPMVDVTFLLLIFFMVTAAYSLQKSIEVPPPDQSESAAQARTLEEIEEDDDYVIIEIHRDNTVWVNEREAPSRQEVLSILREAKQGPAGSGSGGPSSLLVLAEGDARHETVVMALDAGNDVGMENVRLATVDEEDF